ncbi:uncharacterized protein LOC101853253 isoform X3 [Aplysia californica]|uniref:Uncharacterized protein LOC101853253 isoform X3 n=1 Tax=Aplysia californica TaxID=6500 RepID=A0ABM1VYH9_APLCA|nr:uncharacterized protein LOC101853253 isoform X3 [Aplysia californica]
MNSKCCNSEVTVYLQAYFVTIATILGTGILGLPVTLVNSGLYPFLITFILDAVVQSLLVHFFVDLLQRAVAAQHVEQREESVPLNTMLEEDIDLESDDGDELTNGAIMKGKMQHIREVPLVQPPNLHLLGKLFLGCGLQQVFDMLIILQFIALLVCYALAGSEAFAQLIGIDHFYVIPVFVWVLTTAIVFALSLIQPVVSVLTFVKGSLLLGTAMVTFYVGLTVAEEISNDFSYIGAPFLMGTVALGGVCNTMPYTFEKVPFKKNSISKYRLAVQLGLWTCVLLNILWCWAVLDIVPQTIAMACSNEAGLSLRRYDNDSGKMFSGLQTCYGKLSLESAEANGEISTLPLTKLLQRDHPSFTWVAILVEVFIMVSITVSYLTIGTALHHTLKGIVQSFLAKRRGSSTGKGKSSKTSAAHWFAITGVSLGAFTIVFAIAMVDPEGFVDILEKLVSFTLNLEVGLFFFLMFIWSKRNSYVHLEVPLPMSQCLYYLIYLLPVFFNFAVIYDVYNTVMDIAYPQQHQKIVFNVSSSTTVGSVPDNAFTLNTTVSTTTTTPLADNVGATNSSLNML